MANAGILKHTEDQRSDNVDPPDRQGCIAGTNTHSLATGALATGALATGALATGLFFTAYTSSLYVYFSNA